MKELQSENHSLKMELLKTKEENNLLRDNIRKATDEMNRLQTKNTTLTTEKQRPHMAQSKTSERTLECGTAGNNTVSEGSFELTIPTQNKFDHFRKVNFLEGACIQIGGPHF